MIKARNKPNFRHRYNRGKSQLALRLKERKHRSLIPNMITVTSLCAGLSGIRFGLLAKWELAVAAVLIAALLDTMDGRVARLLGSSSLFGAELDSLSDFVSFGVAPALIMYLHNLHLWGSLGWAACLFFAICGSLRLARFNTTKMDQPLADNFFTGVPIPAAAGLALMPLMIDFTWEETWLSVPQVTAPFLVVVGLLMVSRLKTFSFKKVRVSQHWIIPLLVSVALLGVAIVNAPWPTLVFLGFIYAALLPISAWQARRLLKLQGDKNVTKASGAARLQKK